MRSETRLLRAIGTSLHFLGGLPSLLVPLLRRVVPFTSHRNDARRALLGIATSGGARRHGEARRGALGIGWVLLGLVLLDLPALGIEVIPRLLDRDLLFLRNFYEMSNVMGTPGIRAAEGKYL